MKVTDIITPVNEGLVSKLFGSFKGELIKDATEALKRQAGKYGGEVDLKTVTQHIHGMGTKASHAVMDDPKIAQTVMNAVNRSMAINQALKSSTAVSKFLAAAGFTVSSTRAVYNYLSRMKDAEDKVAAGEWTEDNYAAVRQQEMSVLITTLVAGLPIVGSRLLGVMGKLPFLGSVYKDVALLQSAALASYLAFLNTDRARNFLAAAAIYSLSDIPVIGPYISKLGIDIDVSRIVGAAGVQIVDFFKPSNAVGGGQAQPSTAQPNAQIQSTSPTAQPGADASPAAAAPVVPTAAQATNVAGWN